MKNFILTIICLFSLTVAQAKGKEITAKVVFQNSTGKAFTSGKFLIKELGKVIDIQSTENFTVTLPEKGRYSFSFLTEDFSVVTYYPARITADKNVITVRLEEKDPAIGNRLAAGKSVKVNGLTNEQLEGLIAEGKVNFIFHSIHKLTFDFGTFKEKYGIGYISNNCLIDPLTLKQTIEHNLRIQEYLNEKYGEGWKKDLPSTPFGLQ